MGTGPRAPEFPSRLPPLGIYLPLTAVRTSKPQNIPEMRNPTRLSVVIIRVNRFRLITGMVLALGLLPLISRATTVIAPDFDSLVKQADFVVRAVVKSKTAEWRRDGRNRHIITKVTLDVREIIKGAPTLPLVLEMLGGRIGTEEMVVEGAPGFIVGDEQILFVRGNGRQFFPLVAIMYGQFLVTHDSSSGQDFVQRSNGSPLYNVKDVTLPMTVANAIGLPAPRPLTAAEFAGKIRASLAQRPVTPPANAN